MKALNFVVSLLFALGFMAMTNNAKGGITTEPLTVTVSGGPFDGVIGTGSFSYDSGFASINGSSVFLYNPSPRITLTLFGQTFTEADDARRFTLSALPSFTLDDSFIPSSLNYAIAESGSNPVAIDEPSVIGISIFGSLVPAASGGFEIAASVTVVPEPSSLLLGVLTTLGLLMRRRRTS